MNTWMRNSSHIESGQEQCEDLYDLKRIMIVLSLMKLYRSCWLLMGLSGAPRIYGTCMQWIAHDSFNCWILTFVQQIWDHVSRSSVECKHWSAGSLVKCIIQGGTLMHWCRLGTVHRRGAAETLGGYGFMNFGHIFFVDQTWLYVCFYYHYCLNALPLRPILKFLGWFFLASHGFTWTSLSGLNSHHPQAWDLPLPLPLPSLAAFEGHSYHFPLHAQKISEV